MKKILVVLAFFIFSIGIITLNMQNTSADSGFCYLCGSGSSCQQCASGSGKDTQADRKACEQKGCKISGTSSCSTAANVKKC